MFSVRGNLSLSRVDDICRVLQLDFADLARRVADAEALLEQLQPEQERAMVADKKLLLAAICVQSQWSLAQLTATYRLTEAECVRCFAQLDRIGVIEPKPLNCYRLKLAKTFRWRPHGAVMQIFESTRCSTIFPAASTAPMRACCWCTARCLGNRHRPS